MVGSHIGFLPEVGQPQTPLHKFAKQQWLEKCLGDTVVTSGLDHKKLLKLLQLTREETKLSCLKN